MTTRRNFLTQAGMLSAAALLSPQLLSAKDKHVIGLQLYTLRDELPKGVKGVIAKVAAAGYKEVETFGYTKNEGFWGLQPAAFKALLTSHGLTTPSGHYGQDQIYSNKWDELKESIAIAKSLGQSYLTIPYIGDQFRKTGDDIKRVSEKIVKASEICRQEGIKAAYHNHDFEFKKVDGITMFDTLLKDSDAKLLQFELDLYWVVRAGGDPVKLFSQHPGRFALVHVKDMDKAKPDLNTEVGNGSINYKNIVAKAKQAGVKHYIMEQENFNIDPYTSITQSCRYMRDVLHV